MKFMHLTNARQINPSTGLLTLAVDVMERRGSRNFHLRGGTEWGRCQHFGKGAGELQG